MSRSSALRVDVLVVKFQKMREVRERLDFDKGIQPRGWCLKLVMHLTFMRTRAEAKPSTSS